MPSSLDVLSYQTLTTSINEIKSPNSFVKRLLFGNHVSLATETVEVGIFVGGRQIAPFVRKHGEALMVGGLGTKMVNIEAPNIRIKRPFTASQLYNQRSPGYGIFEDGGRIRSAMAQWIARDVQFMADQITNTEEYMCAMALRGAFSYEVEDQEVFTITYGRTGTHAVTLSVFWDTDPTLALPEEDFTTAKRLVSEDVGLNVTDVILGSEASTHFKRVMKKQGASLLDLRDLNAGSVSFAAQFAEDGTMFIGTFGGVRVWEYARKVLVNGVSTDLIRPKYAEFVSATSGAENVLYYGAIPDMDAPGGLFIGERFSKSWTNPDPSVRMHLAASRPLAVLRRPDSTVSMKVISG